MFADLLGSDKASVSGFLKVKIYVDQGVTQPPVEPVVAPATFGFVYNAERLNSRAAMVSMYTR